MYLGGYGDWPKELYVLVGVFWALTIVVPVCYFCCWPECGCSDPCEPLPANAGTTIDMMEWFVG